ncbi:MAG: TolC family protein, partial [Pseudoalteromonas sp.]
YNSWPSNLRNCTYYPNLGDVETAITREESLKERYQATLEAQANALAAEQLSFEQYQSGLVTYTTVLDAQDRSFDAQSSVIEIKNQLIINRINLHIALGGDFSQPQDAESTL